MNYDQLLKKTYPIVEAKGKESEAIKLLLMAYSGLDQHQFYLSLKMEVPKNIEQKFLEAVDQYVQFDVPIQHLIGHAYFYARQFIVNNHVLIPRLETEQLIEHVLYYYDLYFAQKPLSILDLGTGSGCIGLTLGLEIPDATIHLSDISQDALGVAKQNGTNLGVDAEYILSDVWENIHQKFDIIVSNPPYIPSMEVVDPMVLKEPHVALFGGVEGIDFYERILSNVKKHINENALIAFEHGYQQKKLIHQLVRKHLPHAHIIQLKDLQGKDRFTFVGQGNVLDQSLN